MNAIPLKDEVYYPESDGEPMAETELHLEELVYVWQALKDRFQDEPDVFVGANLFLYFRRGDPSAVVAPDGFVVKVFQERFVQGPAPSGVRSSPSQSAPDLVQGRRSQRRRVTNY